MKQNYSWYLLISLVVGIGGGCFLYDASSSNHPGPIADEPSPKKTNPTIVPRSYPPLSLTQPPATEDQNTHLLRRKEELLVAHQALLRRIPANTTEKFLKSRQSEYAALLESWGLSPAEIDQVYGLIFNRDKTISDIEFTIRLDEAAKLMTSISAECSRQLRDIIGEERTQSLLTWEDSRRDRRIFEQFSSSLPEKDAGLEVSKEQVVLDALYQTRKYLSQNGRKVLSQMGSAYADEVIGRVSSHLTVPQQLKLREAINNSLRR